jgi:hypothetical protein
MVRILFFHGIQKYKNTSLFCDNPAKCQVFSGESVTQ